MKIMIMQCKDKNIWYANKIGKTFKVIRMTEKYETKFGPINKNDAVVIEK